MNNPFKAFVDMVDAYFSANEQEEIKKLKSEKESLEFKLFNAESEITDLESANDELEDLLGESLADKELEDQLNSNYPKISRRYSREETDGHYSIDVRNFYQVNDETIPVVSGKTNDDKALAALKKTKSLIKYTDDKSSYNFGEYWAYAYQTLKRGVGDCEDGAILLANIMLRSGIPYYRVRLNAGSVNGGGHAYVTYCRETDNEWVVLDWCYWYNTLPVSERKTHKEERNYMDAEKNYYVWFSWNQKYIFGEQKLTALEKDHNFE